MRILTVDEIKLLKPPRITEEEYLSLPSVWCVICEKFIPRRLHQSFSSDHEMGGHYCGWHSNEEIEAKKLMTRGRKK